MRSGRRAVETCAGVLALSLFAVGCHPPPNTPDAGTPEPVVPADAGTPPEDVCVTAHGTAPDAPLRRLTRDEYDNTVRDLLGDDSRPAQAFPPDSEAMGFDNQASSQDVSTPVAEAWADAAEALAARADLSRLLPCDPSAPGVDLAACGKDFIQTFGRRAFRRPLDDDERARFEALFAAQHPETDFPAAARFLIEVMLQSPQFLYRLELGDPTAPGDRIPLGDYELASRLSYLLWASMPDEALLQAAAKGELRTKEGMEAQARRMIADPKARQMVGRFALQWLGLTHFGAVSKDEARFPGFAAAQPLLEEEAQLFVAHAMLDGSGDATRLFNGRETYLNGPLARFYRLPLVEGDTFQRVSLEHTAREGVLTLGAVLAQYARVDQSSPVLRGKFVRERLLCERLPNPPPNVVQTLPSPDKSTTRERFADHANNPSCAGCHRRLEPVGFGLENFDAEGSFRNEENGTPIDASGNVMGTEDLDGPFNGAGELSERLAHSAEVKHCLALQWFRFAFGRGETQSPVDRCAVQQVDQAFEGSSWDVRELLVAIIRTDAFRFRGRVDTGGTP